MIPRKYWQFSAPAHTPDSSVPQPPGKDYKSEDGQLEEKRHHRRRFWWLTLAISILLLGLILGLSLGLTRAHHDSALSAIVDLGYSKYQGNTYSQGVSQWLGIRYASPPTGNLRFAAPRDPTKDSTLQKANKVTQC